jgi:16S rRNA processing protein RimM
LTLVTAGRVGKPHGLDGSFYVDDAAHGLPEGTALTVGSAVHVVERRGGGDQRPLIRLSGLDDPRPLRGELLLAEMELAEDEWLAGDLMGCDVHGRGRVRRVLGGPSCDVLELDDGTLVPFVSDAIALVDTARGRIEVREGFLA